MSVTAASTAAAASPEWRVAYAAGPANGGVPVVLGESPVWNHEGNYLYFVDIDGKRIHRLQWTDAASGTKSSSPTAAAVPHECVQLPWLVGSHGLVSSAPSSTIWLATSLGVHLFCWRTLRSTLLSPLPDRPDTRLNDAKVTPQGDLLLGTLVTESNAAKRKGRGHVLHMSSRGYSGFGGLNRLESTTAEPILAGATLSNGMDFVTPGEFEHVGAAAAAAASAASSSSSSSTRLTDGSTRVYWIDTALRRIDQFDLHGCAAAASSSLGVIASSHRQVVPSLGPCSSWIDPATGSAIGGDPDGMVVDEEGMVWVAMNGGGCVVRVDPSGGGGGGNPVRRVLRFPVSKVTSLCFGGSGLRSLFVTSASKGVDQSREPLAGSVFVIPDVGVAGRRSYGLRGNFDMDASPSTIVQHQRLQLKPTQQQQQPRAKL